MYCVDISESFQNSNEYLAFTFKNRLPYSRERALESLACLQSAPDPFPPSLGRRNSHGHDPDPSALQLHLLVGGLIQERLELQAVAQEHAQRIEALVERFDIEPFSDFSAK